MSKRHQQGDVHTMLGQMRIRIRQAQQRATELRTARSLVESSHQSAAALVHKRAMKMIRAVKERRNELVRELYDMKAEQCKTLDAEISDIEFYTDTMMGACEQAESLLAMEIAGVYADLQIQISEILGRSPSSTCIQQVDMANFCPDSMPDIRIGDLITNKTVVSTVSLEPIHFGSVDTLTTGMSNDTGHCSDFESDDSFLEISMSDQNLFALDDTVTPTKNTDSSFYADEATAIDSGIEHGYPISYEEFKRHSMKKRSSEKSGLSSKESIMKKGNSTRTSLVKSVPSIPSYVSESSLVECNNRPANVKKRASKSTMSLLDKLRILNNPEREFDDLCSPGDIDANWRSTPIGYDYYDEPRLVCCVSRWGTDAGRINVPCDVSFLSNGHIAVAENNRVQIFDKVGQSVRSIAEDYIKPRNLAVTPQGHIAVIDKKDRCIKIFNIKGKLLRSWGKGVFDTPTNLAIYGYDKFIITDKNSVRVFLQDGRTVKEFGAHGIANQSIKPPSYLAVDAQQNMFISSYVDHCVYMYDSSGELIRKIGKKGKSNGKLKNPRGITFDRHDNLIVADNGNNRISVFDKDGQFVRHLLVKSDRVKYPDGIAFHKDEGYLAFTENGMKDKLKIYQIYK